MRIAPRILYICELAHIILCNSDTCKNVCGALRSEYFLAINHIRGFDVLKLSPYPLNILVMLDLSEEECEHINAHVQVMYVGRNKLDTPEKQTDYLEKVRGLFCCYTQLLQPLIKLSSSALTDHPQLQILAHPELHRQHIP
ncbi:hypothetical protein chiPu_0021854 [Chiloscyllium punctatum]|uniref:Uncharacterized protein n=1 Tax=Chiloscyllium punctatum TaxID=137246 RepID=A0A401RE15_CHIPU|nr:hypothetical protein [Chiloscyllium punctatum]